MVQYPEIQKQAQAYIDVVTGKTRLPDFSDRNSLPYIEAILLEALRWHPIVPLGKYTLSKNFVRSHCITAAPHRAIEEDEYNGYRIPSGNQMQLVL